MSEEKKEGSCCSSGGHGCCPCLKLVIGVLLGAFIFAAGIWFAKAHCHMDGKFCPMGASMMK
jgi:hypothetical protein